MGRSSENTRKLPCLSAKLLAGTAFSSIAFLLAGASAFAQTETVTVTGTTIRGQQPVGSNVITVDRATIEATGVQTTQQLLATVPQLDSFGAAGQGGGQNTADVSSSPTIHSLGNSGAASTLILIDGHRFPASGLTGLSDPSSIPAAAIQNVEVMPDGASAIYGSDAVAGVINVHTRKEYSGFETGVQYGGADHYNSFDFSQLIGHDWDSGSVLAVYNYSNRSNLMNSSRSFITARQDLRLGAADPNLFGGLCNPSGGVTTGCVAVAGSGSAGTVSGLQTVTPNGQAVPYPSEGGNFQNFACPVATIATSASASVPAFAYPYAGTTAVPRQTSLGNNGPGTGICDTSNYASALPSEVRNQGLIAMRQRLDDRLSLNMDFVYSSRLTSARSAIGSLTNVAVFNPNGGGDTAFGAANSAAALQFTNPFYVGVPGAAANANSEFVTVDLDQLLASQGRGYQATKVFVRSAFTTLGIDYDAGNDWLLSLGGTFGVDSSGTLVSGGLNTAEALLALNGTSTLNGTAATSPNSSVIIDTYGLGTVLTETRALTKANALDVWNPVATNRTSAAELRSLVDSASSQTALENLEDVTLHGDGPLGDFWGAGQIKAAVGAEYTHNTGNGRVVSNSTAGPASTISRTTNVNLAQTVYSAYTEFVVPLIGPSMDVPLMKSLTFDLAARYDRYNTFGDTENPKFALNWGIIDGLSASASMGTSFTAPHLSNVGDPVTHLGTTSSVSASNSGASNNLVVLFNDTRPFNNGAGVAGTFVSNAYACAAAGSQPVTDATGSTNATLAGGVWTNASGCKVVNQNGSGSQGLTVFTGNPNLKPQLGQTYSANILFDDFGKFWDVLEGASVQVTYYQAKYTGANTNIGVITTQTNNGLPQLTTFGPANCTGSGASTVCTPGWSQSDPVVAAAITRAPLANAVPVTVYSIQDNSVQNAFNLWQNGLDFRVAYRLETDDYGSFTLSASGNEILRASQQNIGTATIFDTKGGRNGGRFPDIEFTGRGTISWHLNPFSAGVSFNYQHPYNTGNTTFPYNLAGPGRLANQQHIGAQETVDINMVYNLSPEIWSGTSMSLNVTNLFDAPPPFRDVASGQAGGSVIGRFIEFGVKKTW